MYTPVEWCATNLFIPVVAGIMHVCPAFFAGTPSQQATDVAHEFGRYYARIFGENTGNYRNDIYMWDNVISMFASGYADWAAQAEGKGNE